MWSYKAFHAILNQSKILHTIKVFQKEHNMTLRGIYLIKFKVLRCWDFEGCRQNISEFHLYKLDFLLSLII